MATEEQKLNLPLEALAAITPETSDGNVTDTEILYTQNSEKTSIKTEETKQTNQETELIKVQHKKKIRGSDANKKAIELGSYVYIYRVTDVSLTNQRFKAYFHIEFQWSASEEELLKFEKDPEHYEPIDYTPKFICMNGKFELNRCKSFKVVTVGDKNSWNMRIYKMRDLGSDNKTGHINLGHFEFEGEFNERFELENFPLDCQDLQIVFEAGASISKVVFMPPIVIDYFAGGISLESSQLDTYDVHSLFLEYDLNDYGYEENAQSTDNDSKFSKLVIRMKLERKYRIYLFKIGIFVFVTSASSLMVFSMDTDQINDRYGMMLTLLLTMVAFQFVVSSTLPKLPYLTFLDYYVIVSFVFLFFIILQTMVVSVIDRNSEFGAGHVDDFDFYSFWTSLSIFTSYHIIFAIRGIKARREELTKLPLDGLDIAALGVPDKYVKNMYIDSLFERDAVISKAIAHQVNIENYSDVKRLK